MTVCATGERELSRTRFWYVAAAVGGTLAALKGLRLPSRWAATQAQMDYSQGFVKRGLFGAIVSDPLHLEIYRRFMVVAFLLLFALGILLVRLALKSGVAERTGGAEVLALFFGSYSVTMLMSTVGYLDIPLLILTVVVISVRRPMWRLAVALPLTIVGVLIHESYVLLYLPVILLSFLLQYWDTNDARERRSVLLAGALLLIAVAITAKLAWNAPMTAGQAQAMIARVNSRVDFDQRLDFYKVMLLSTEGNRTGMDYWYAMRDWWYTQVECAFIYGPTILMMLWMARRVLKGTQAGKIRWAFPAVVVCGCAPVLIHWLAWDSARFNGILCTMVFLALIATVRFTKGEALAPSNRQQCAAMVVLLTSMASGGLLMSHADNQFPFFTRAVRLRRQLETMTLPEIVRGTD